jgi:hypothetical protein
MNEISIYFYYVIWFLKKISLQIFFCSQDIVESIELDRVQRVELNLLCYHLERVESIDLDRVQRVELNLLGFHHILHQSMKTLLFCGGACWSRENPFRDPTGLLLRRESGGIQEKILENLDRIRKERRMIRRQRISRPREGLGWNIGRPAETDIFAGVTPGWFLARGETRCRGKWQSRRRDNSFGTSRDGIAFDRIWPGDARCKDTWQTSFF